VSTFEIRRGADRARSRTEWLDSRHSFAFGSHYDPDNTGFGWLQAFNEDVLRPGPGYPVHAHRDVEILTWVLAGSLTHRDDAGEATVILPGQLHHVSAGSGIQHTEASTSPSQAVHLMQMWLRPDEFGLVPSHRLVRVGDRLESGRLVRVASGLADPGDQQVLRIRQRGAALSIGRLPTGATVTLPAAPCVHLFVAAGSVGVDTAEGGTGQQGLAAGDALRITGGRDTPVTALEPAELLVWEFGGPAG
jgi:hypothetical protein